MSLPETAKSSGFLNPKKIESLILPGLIVIILTGVIIAGFLIPKRNEEDKEKREDASIYTEAASVKTAEGKTVGVSAAVQQISAEDLRTQLEAKVEILVVQITEKDEWKEPHIKGTIFYPKTNFASSPSLDPKKSHVFVSEDGYEGILALNSILKYGFPRDKNFNLEGGLQAWKKKGYPLEN